MAVWTEQQRNAIEIRGKSVIVSAAAGSGKTSVLVERIARILADSANPVPADSIVVVTFTNDAAAGMKERLSKELSRMLESDRENTWLSEQLMYLHTAKISTIHSFCFDLIREYPDRLMISSGFRVIDETESSLILSDAVETVFERMYTDERELMDALCDAFCSRNDTALAEIVTKLYRYTRSLPFARKWADDCLKYVSQPFNPDNDIYVQSIVEYAESEIRAAVSQFKLANEYAIEISADKAAGILDDEAVYYCAMADNLINTSLEWDERIFTVEKKQTMTFPKYEVGSDEDNRRNMIKKLRESAYERLSALSTVMLTKADIDGDYAFEHDILGKLFRLLFMIYDETERVKKEKNVLGFDDAEHLALSLLADISADGTVTKSQLACELSDKYKMIMVDEFQDTNDIQDIIFRLLTHNGTAEESGDNLFAVGDVKQSIYRFRMANPKVFLRTLRSSYRYTPDTEADHVAVLLNKNFRSSNEVVEFVNFIFSQIMTAKNGDVDYIGDEMLVRGAEYDDTSRTTEIILSQSIDLLKKEQGITSDDGNGAASESAVSSDGGDISTAFELERIETEAEAVAAKIKSMIGDGITVSDKGVTRPCRGGDFCVLLRDRERGTAFEKALNRFGIKSRTDEMSGYLTSREITVLLNLLRAADNPLQDIPLAAVLMSPVFMLDADEMLRIRLFDRTNSLYGAVLEALEHGDSEASYYTKLEYFEKVVTGIRHNAAVMSVEAVIRHIYDDTDFMGVMNKFDDGEQKQANLRLLINYARSYEEASEGGLTGFLRYVDNVAASGGDFVRAGTSKQSDETVSIKTIHKSKGLEYPFVFLCGTYKKFNMTDFSGRYIADSELGLGLRIQSSKAMRKYPSFSYEAICHKQKSEMTSEEMRLLYVALTRARERLFIVFSDCDRFRKATEKIHMDFACSGGIITDEMISSSNSMEKWLITALLRHPKVFLPREEDDPYTDVDSFSADDVPDVLGTTYVCRGGESFAEEKKEYPAADDTLVEKLYKKMTTAYENRLSKLPAKLTVTDIAKSKDGLAVTIERPQFILDSEALTSAEIGTLTHRFLEFADYRSARNDTAAELNRLINAGTISSNMAKQINLTALKGFFASELCGRMLNAEKIERERKFLIRIDDIDIGGELAETFKGTNGMLQGIVDCVFHESDGIVLLDYKTDKVSSADALIERYSRQLYLYRIAMEVIYRKKVKNVYLYSLHLNKSIELKEENHGTEQ